jgi:hypothetical protein
LILINPRGELAWFQQDPRGIDVQFAQKLLLRVAQEARDNTSAPE